MKAGWIGMAGLCALALMSGFGQTFAPTPNRSSSQVDLQALAKKIDEQNAKIDMLSQQILKLQQQIAASGRPGVMIGEPTPGPSTAATSPEPSRPTGNGNTHIVARGETLIAIAKAHGVSVTDLQKANHIDNPTKLQAGQTIVIPSASSPTPSGSPGD
jgi:nucleoid-associated protein YgaU